jgi:hypothetical protein
MITVSSLRKINSGSVLVIAQRSNTSSSVNCLPKLSEVSVARDIKTDNTIHRPDLYRTHFIQK